MKKEKTNIPIMFCFDKNYVIPAAAAFYSLLEHASKKYNYTFYVLHSDISDEQQEKLKETIKEFNNCTLEFVNMNNRFDDIWGNIYAGGHFSKEVMYKLLVASIFPTIDKIIVSDVDVIFLNDISESFFELTDKDDAYVAGVKPIGKISHYLDNYAPEWTADEISKLGNLCGGYLVMNLKKIREDNFEKVLLKSLDDNGYRLNQMEQDILNITCYGKIKHLHLKYVACSYMWDYYKTDEDKSTDSNYSKEEIEEAMKNPVQLHYATGVKPWKNVDCTLSSVWFEYIVKTPFIQEYLNDLPNKIVLPEDRIVRSENNNKHVSLYRRIVNRIPTKIKYAIKHPSIFLKKKTIKRIKRKIFKKKYSLLIFDDVFPLDLSPFRYQEFMEYSLDNYNTYFAVSGRSFNYFKEYRQLDDIIVEFQEKNPHFYGRVFNVSKEKRTDGLEKIKRIKNPLAVFTFVNNLINEEYDNLTFLEENNIPFIITLYPGGGLKINDKDCDKKLKRIFSSKCFRKAIVTQDNVKEYLLSNNICKKTDIEMIFGVVIAENVLKGYNKKRLYYPDKKFFNVCFVAHKYSEKGKDKGYDLFVEAAKKICENPKYKRMRFHVVGDFNEKDIDVSDIKNKIVFHGILPNDELIKLYQESEIIVSPTRPFILSKGSFDGFPTSVVTEAIINGNVAITTDELSLNNSRFVQDKEIIIIKPNSKDIISNIEELFDNSDKYNNILNNGKRKAKNIYSTKNQIGKRLKIIHEIAKKEY